MAFFMLCRSSTCQNRTILLKKRANTKEKTWLCQAGPD